MSQRLEHGHPPHPPLSVEEALERLSQRLAWYGPTMLRVGRIVTVGQELLTAEIVSGSGKVVRKFQIDRRTGVMRLIDGFAKAALITHPVEPSTGRAAESVMPCTPSLAGAKKPAFLSRHVAN